MPVKAMPLTSPFPGGKHSSAMGTAALVRGNERGLLNAKMQNNGGPMPMASLKPLTIDASSYSK